MADTISKMSINHNDGINVTHMADKDCVSISVTGVCTYSRMHFYLL